MITPENIVRHELIGLDVRVSDSSGKILLEGRVIDETRNMLVIEKEDSEKKIPKEGNFFSFLLPESGEKVKVEGRIIVARPEDRIKKKFEKW